MSIGHPSRGTLSFALGAVIAGVTLLASASQAVAADPAPKAEVMVIHATKCTEKSIDPAIGKDVPPLGYDCLKLLEKSTIQLPLNQTSTLKLKNDRVFHLLFTGMTADARYKVTASINPTDGGATVVKLADIVADANKPFNVGGFTYNGGVLLLTVRVGP